MNTTVFAFDRVHLMGDVTMRPPVSRLPRHAALLLLAGISPLRRHALPGTPSTALAGASNCRL
jgi:hypothetical protein